MADFHFGQRHINCTPPCRHSRHVYVRAAAILFTNINAVVEHASGAIRTQGAPEGERRQIPRAGAPVGKLDGLYSYKLHHILDLDTGES